MSLSDFRIRKRRDRWHRSLQELPISIDARHDANQLWEKGEIRKAVDHIQNTIPDLNPDDAAKVEQFCKVSRHTWSSICLDALKCCRSVEDRPLLSAEQAAWERWAGFPDRARRTLEQAAESYPENPTIHKALSDLVEEESKLKHSVINMATLGAKKRSIETTKNSLFDQLYDVARCYFEIGAQQHADPHIQLANAISPNDKCASELLKRVTALKELSQDDENIKRLLESANEANSVNTQEDELRDIEMELYDTAVDFDKFVEYLDTMPPIRGIREYAFLGNFRNHHSEGMPKDKLSNLIRAATEISQDGLEAAQSMSIGRLQDIVVDGQDGSFHVMLLRDGLLLALADQDFHLDHWVERVKSAILTNTTEHPDPDLTEDNDSLSPTEKLTKLSKVRGFRAAALFDREGRQITTEGEWSKDAEELAEIINGIVGRSAESCQKISLGTLVSGQFFTPSSLVQIAGAQDQTLVCFCNPPTDAERLEVEVRNLFGPPTVLSEKTL